MANKERNKRSARKARAEERAQREALQAEATPEASAKATKVEAKKQEKSVQRNANPGFFGRLGAYFCRRSYRNAPRCVAFNALSLLVSL